MAGNQAVPATRGTSQSAMIALVDGLIERMFRAPLMRRAPAQCSPEEQTALAGLLAEVMALRNLRTALEALPALPSELVVDYWPELATILNSKKSAAAKPRATAGARPAPALGGLYDALVPDAETENGTLVATEAAAAAAGSTAEQNDATRETVTASATVQPAGQDLAPQLKEALLAHGKPLNTTQMLTWLHERGLDASREDVMNALFGHEELFKKRGAGHWVVVGSEPA